MNTKKIIGLIVMLFVFLQIQAQVNPTAAIKPAPGENYILISQDTFSDYRFVYDSIEFRLSGDTLYFTDSIKVDVSSLGGGSAGDSIKTLENYQALLDFDNSSYQHDLINVDSFQYTDSNGVTKTVPRSSWIYTNTNYSDSLLLINGWQRVYDGQSIKVDWVGWGTDNEQSQKAIDVAVTNKLDVDWGNRTYIIDDRLNIREVNDMELRGNGAILKYPSGSTLNTTLSAAYTANSTTITVSNVPSGWSVGDFIRMATDSTNSNTSNASKITNIAGNTITVSPDFRSQFGGSFGNQSIGTNVCKTLNIMYGKPSFTEAQYGEQGTNEGVKIIGFVFDGNKSDGNEVILSWTHNTIFQGQGRNFVIEGNKFINCPNEILSGHGLRIEGNTFENSGGSPYHLSSHDTTFNEIYPSFFVNNKVINCNLIDREVNGHNEGQITFSWNGGYLVISGNWFIGNGANNSILGALTTFTSTQNNREQVIFADNYCRNFESVFYSFHQSETYGYNVTGNTFDSCGTIDLGILRRNDQNLWEDNLILGTTTLTGQYRDVWVDSLIRFNNILAIDGSESDSATLWQGTNGKLYYTDGVGTVERISPVVTTYNADELAFGESGGGDLTQSSRLKYSTAFGLELQGVGSSNVTRTFFNTNDDGNNILSTFSGGKISIASAMDIFPIDASGNESITTSGKGIKLVSKGSIFQTVSEGIFVIDRTSTQNFGGTSTNVRFKDNFNPSAGAHNKNHFVLNQTINQTGTASGDVIDFLINPTFTSLLGNYTALEIRNGSSTGFNVTGTGDNVISGNLEIGGTLKDSDGDSGTSGQVLSSTATGTNWIANSNLYTGDGTLSSNRTITMGTNDLTIQGINGSNVNSTSFDNNINSFSITNGTSTTTLEHRATGLDLKLNHFKIINDNVDQLYITDNETNSTTKNGSIVTPHYTNSEEPFLWLTTQAGSSFNSLRFGGGNSAGNAATVIDFHTASNNTTTTGTRQMRITSDGTVEFTELINLAPQSTVPSSPSSGDIYMDDGTNITGSTPTLRYYNGTSWVDLN